MYQLQLNVLNKLIWAKYFLINNLQFYFDSNAWNIFNFVLLFLSMVVSDWISWGKENAKYNDINIPILKNKLRGASATVSNAVLETLK